MRSSRSISIEVERVHQHTLRDETMQFLLPNLPRLWPQELCTSYNLTPDRGFDIVKLSPPAYATPSLVTPCHLREGFVLLRACCVKAKRAGSTCNHCLRQTVKCPSSSGWLFDSDVVDVQAGAVIIPLRISANSEAPLRKSFSRLCVAHISRHSFRTASSPRLMKESHPRDLI